MALLAALGAVDIGEARDQEARAKRAELGLDGAPETSGALARLQWHLIGRLQTNKARSVAGYADLVHTVDRAELAAALGKAAAGADRGPLPVLAQASLDGDPTRGGATRGDLPALLEAIAGQPGLALRGLMVVAPREGSPSAHFAEAADLMELARAQSGALEVLSAGMSGDFEAAIEHGATHVRVGTALLGYRAPILG